MIKKILCFIIGISGSLIAQTSYTWTGTSSSVFSIPTNWTPNGIPLPIDNITIVTGSNPCVIAATTTVTNLTITSGTLNIGSFLFSATGTTSVNAGTVAGSGTLSCTGNKVVFGTTAGGPTVAPIVSITTNSVTMQRGTYASAVTVYKNPGSSSTDSWRGGNIFNGVFTLTNAAVGDTIDPHGDIYLGSNAADPIDVFNANSYFYLTGSARIRVPQYGTATFNKPAHFYSMGLSSATLGSYDRIQPARFSPAAVTYNDSAIFYCSSATTDIYIAYDPGTAATFNGIVVGTHSGTSQAGFYFGGGGTIALNNDIYFNNIGSGTINLVDGAGSATLANGKRILVGSLGFSSGKLSLQNFTQIGGTAQNMTLTGTAGFTIGSSSTPCVFNGNVNFTSPTIVVLGSTFNGTATFLKTGISGDSWGGNNFTKAFTCTSNNTGNLLLSNTIGSDLYATTVSLTTAGSGNISASRTYSVTYNDNITVNSTGTGGIYFGPNGGASTLVNNKTLTCGTFTSGVLYLRKFTQVGGTAQTITTTGTANVNIGNGYNNPCSFDANITLNCANNLTLDSSTFKNVVTVNASILNFTYNFFNTVSGTTTITKTGTTGDASGGNIFNGTTSITNNNNGNCIWSNTKTGDVFNKPLTLVNSTTGNFYMSRIYNASYNDNILLTNSSTGTIYFGNGGGNSTLATGKTISCNSFNNGALELRRFTQLGTTSQTLYSSGAATFRFGNGSTTSNFFNGDVTVNATNGAFIVDTSFFYGAMTVNTSSLTTFRGNYNSTSGTTSFTKLGGGTESSGSNVFNGVTTIINQGTGIYYFGNASRGDVFQSDLTITNNSTGSTNMAYNYPSIFNSNVRANSNNGDVTFGVSGGTSVMAATKSIGTGAGGFSGSANFNIYDFTQNGTAANAFTLNSNANLNIGIAAYPSTLGGNLNATVNNNFSSTNATFMNSATISASGLSVQTSTFNVTAGTTTITKSNSGVADNNGGNTFNGALTLTNSSSSVRWWMGQTNPDIYNNTVTINANNSGLIEMTRTKACTFNNNIIINSTSNGGITFGNNGGTSTQGVYNISTGTFNNGSLDIRKFIQAAGTQTNTITTTSSVIITIGASATTGCDFGGIMNINCNNQTNLTSNIFRNTFSCTTSGITVSTNTFSAAATLYKNGSTSDGSNGGNTFNGTTSITMNNGGGYLRMGATAIDDYAGDVTFIQSNTSGVLAPSYNTACTYEGSITVNAPSGTPLIFGSGASGSSTLAGGNSVTINKTSGSPDPTFTKLILNKTANDITLNCRVNVSTSLAPTSGVINTTSTNILNMNNGSTTTVGNAASYINGPMNYDLANAAKTTLNFPIGKVADWRPAVLTLKHATANPYTYNTEVFNAAASSLNWTLPATIDTVSGVHYWDLNRYVTGGVVSTPTLDVSGTQTVTLYFGTNDDVRNGNALGICKNTYTATTAWIDIGGTGGPAAAGGAQLAGSITSTSAPSIFNSFSRFTLGSKLTGWNPLPIELLDFSAIANQNKVDLKWETVTETNNAYFTIEKSKDGIIFNKLIDVPGSGNSTSQKDYYENDYQPYDGTSYYRLKQTDFNGNYTYFNIAVVSFNAKNNITFYPNPVKSNQRLNVQVEGYKNQEVLVVLRDVQGKEFYSKVLITQEDMQLFAIDATQQIPPGTYLIVASSNGTIYSQKIIVRE